MTNLKTFNNPEFGSIRTTEVNGTPYFVGKDVAEILGYSDLNKAISMHVDDEDTNGQACSEIDSQSVQKRLHSNCNRPYI